MRGNNMALTIKNALLKIIKNKYIVTLFVIILPFIMEIILYKNYSMLIDKSTFIRIGYIYGFAILVVVYKFLIKRSEKLNKILDFIVKHRYKIAFIIFAILVLLKVNFSSIGMWNQYIKEGVDTTAFGEARAIRSDEWLVTTPFNLSQEYVGFSAQNENLDLGNNDMNIFHAPVLDASVIVKIFSWGYFLFGNEYGLSWSWVLKVIVLFMVFFELGMIITKKDKGMSLLTAIWITFSPTIMWWSIWDNTAFAAGIIVLFHTYLSNKNLKLYQKLLIAYGMVVFICQFVYALYPAWQVPLAYLILVFIVIDFIKYRKNLNVKDYLLMACTIIVTVLLLAYFVITSWDGIQAMMNTKYPGGREITGGDYNFERLVNYYTNFFTPYSNDYENPSDISAFIYPTISVVSVLIIGTIMAIKNKKLKEILKNKNNWYIYGIIGLILVLLSWMMFDWPKILDKITLFYNVQEKRAETIYEFAFVLLTIMLAKKMFDRKEKIINNNVAFIISFAVTILTYFVAKHIQYADTFTTFKLSILLPIIFVMNYTFLSSNKNAFIYVMIIISLFAGAHVNPITIGISPITETEIAKTAVEIAKNDSDAIWIGGSQINAQYLAANGLKVLNGINEYPNYNWVDLIDAEHKYEEVWNRYAHIVIYLDNETYFELLSTDVYALHLNYDAVKKINIKYYYTNEKADTEKINDYKLQTLYENEKTAQYIYQIN